MSIKASLPADAVEKIYNRASTTSMFKDILMSIKASLPADATQKIYDHAPTTSMFKDILTCIDAIPSADAIEEIYDQAQDYQESLRGKMTTRSSTSSSPGTLGWKHPKPRHRHFGSSTHGHEC